MSAVADETFGAWVRRSRRSLDLTQAELAAQVSCSAAAIRKIEAGERKPSRQLAELLAEALHLPAAQRAAFVQAARYGGTWAGGSETDAPVAFALHPPHNLITPLTSLVDRTHDIETLSRLVASPAARLITVIGPPGIGKTRLVLQCGQEVLAQFNDGVWFVDLAPLQQPGELLPAIGLALAARSGEPQAAGVRPPETLEAVRRLLQDQVLLLVLDNFEQIVEAAVDVSALLQGCPGLKVLATSRVPLNVYGEHLYPLPPLSVPPERDGYTPEELMRYEAVLLFTMRLRQHQPGFKLQPSNQAAVIEVARRMEGIPLALELAAAAARHTPLDRLAERLAAPLVPDQPGWLGLIRSPERDLPARQQTLAGMIGWSYALLDPAHQQVFRRLGVLAGEFDAAAAAAVCLDEPGAAGEAAILPMLYHLAEHYLITLTEADAATGEPASWRLLEIMRQFTLEMLDPAERLPAVERHARHFAARLAALQNGTPIAEQHDFVRRFYPDLLAALEWCIQQGQKTLAIEIAKHLSRWWETHGFLRQGQVQLDRVLDMPGEVPVEQHIGLIMNASIHAWQQQQFGRAEALFERGLALAGDDHPGARVDLLNGLARIYIEQGLYEPAEHLLAECLELALAHPERMDPNIPLSQAGEAALARGELDLARRRLEKAIQAIRPEDIPFGPMSRTNLAEVYLALGEPGLARQQLRQCLPAAGMHIRRLCVYLSALSGLLLESPDATSLSAALLGAMHGLSERAGGVYLSLFTRQLTQQRSALAQERLGAEAWRAAWEAGRQWRREEVLEKVESCLAE